MIKFIDLFAGIGGIRRGVVNALNRHGIESRCVLSSEIDERACETYELNYHEHPQGDVREITEVEPFDLVLAGFPCQPFSYAGKRQGFGDTRGTLFFEVERLIEAYRPKAFLLENVRGLYTHDEGRTFQTIIDHLHALGYGTYDLLLNSSDFGVPQNRVRLYILGIRDAQPNMTLVTNLGAVDSHAYRRQDPFYGRRRAVVADILEDNVDPKYFCSARFQEMLHTAIGDDLSKLHGWRMMDYRGGQSVHSWDMGMRGECSDAEKRFMTLLIQNRRHPEFGRHQDGKKLTMEQIRTFYHDDDIEAVAASLIAKGYLKEEDGRYNPVCGNMSFEVFKYLDPQSISITLTSSDCNRLGVIQNNQARHITPRECARLQGFPDDFIVNPNDKFAYKQFGNSVSVPVIEAVFNDFLEHNLEQLGWLNEVQPAQAVPSIVEAKVTRKPQYKQINFLDMLDKLEGGSHSMVSEDEQPYGQHLATLYQTPFHKKLFLARGNAFNYRAYQADGIAAFVKGGFNTISSTYEDFKGSQHDEVRVAEYLYNETWTIDPTPENVNEIVATILDSLVKTKANNIVMPPISIKGALPADEDGLTAQAVVAWLKQKGRKVKRVIIANL